MFPEQIGECFVRQLLDGRHAVARQLLQLVESVVIEGDQLAHDRACLLRRKHTPIQLPLVKISVTACIVAITILILPVNSSV